MNMQDIGVKLSANYNNGVKEGVRVAIDLLREKFNSMKWETGGELERWEQGGDLGNSSEHVRKSSPERTAEVKHALGVAAKAEPYKAWLIERGSPPEYFEHARCGVALWTVDPSEALQFATSGDAHGALLIFDEELQFSRRSDEVFSVGEHTFNGSGA